MTNVAQRRRVTVEFKQQAVERMKRCDNVKELARELKVSRRLLYIWRSKLEGRRRAGRELEETPEQRREKQLREEIARLKTALADRSLEVDFFKAALLGVEETRQKRIEAGGRASTASSSRGCKSKAELA